MLQYSENWNSLEMLSSRVSIASDFGAVSMAYLNKLLKNSKEYWYMGSILARSEMQKKNRLVLMAIDL